MIVTLSFPKLSVFKVMSVHAKTQKTGFSNSSGLQTGFEKLRFREGLAWTVGLTGEIKSSSECGRAQKARLTPVEYPIIH